jgi:hypothetical protein
MFGVNYFFALTTTISPGRELIVAEHRDARGF